MNDDLTKRVEWLEAVLGKGNLHTSSVQQKDAFFNGHFGLVNRTALPAYAKKGELAVKNGAAYVASAANTWTSLSGTTVYGGDIQITGSANLLPTGWGSVLNSHNYTITHNLGNANYVVVATAIGTTTSYVCNTINTSSNSFLISFQTTAGVASDTRFSFILTPIT